MTSEWDVRTRLVRTDAGEEEGTPLNTPLVLSTTFRAHPEGVGFSAEDMGEQSPYFYARWSTPTVRTLERRLADLEGGEDALAHGVGARVAVDATPIGLQPLALGADFVLHSLTKYIGGHGDVLGGVVVGRKTELAALRQDSLIHLGAVLNPFPAWLLLRSLATLPQRMAAHESTAREVAAFLENHPRVRHVLYPGLDSHPQAALARRQLRNTSGMIAFQAEDAPAVARRLAERLKVVHYAVSLGKPHSLLFYLPTDELQRSSFQLSPELLARYRAWAGDGVFRLSIGLEAPADIIRDLAQALAP